MISDLQESFALQWRTGDNTELGMQTWVGLTSNNHAMPPQTNALASSDNTCHPNIDYIPYYIKVSGVL